MRKRARPKQAARRTVRQRLGELSTGVKAAGGLAVAIAAIVGLVFIFFPDWAPDPTPDEGSAEFSEPTLESPVSFGQYLDRIESPRDPYTETQLAQPGAMFRVQLTVKGYEGKELPLRWYVLDRSSGEVVDSKPRKYSFHPDRNDIVLSRRFWTSIPAGTGPFKVVLEIYPPGGTADRPDIVALDEAETAEFPGRG